ncbi:MAG: putative drug exporter of the superfamily [Solirubrobacteraceae bacterium]|nr:putative drug exporter of the superfamily [Solirubrobacteraceae bacterium]
MAGTSLLVTRVSAEHAGRERYSRDLRRRDAAPPWILAEIGLTVAVGILIDTFLVRTLAVPALVTLFGEWSWWPVERHGVPAAFTSVHRRAMRRPRTTHTSRPCAPTS